MRKWLLNSAIAIQCFNLNAASECCNDPCNNFFVEASWLSWQVSSNNYDFLNIRRSVQTTDAPDTLNTRQENDVSQKMPWDSGFRIGLGYDLPCSGLDVRATWTDYHSSGTKSASFGQSSVPNSEVDYIWPPSIDVVAVSSDPEPGDPIDFFARQKISFSFDPVNLEIGKWIAFDCVSVLFRPHVGLQYLEYKDKRTFSRFSDAFEVTPSITGDYNFKQRFQGYGVRAGFDLMIPLFCDVSLVGNVAASIDWGRNKFSYSAETSSPSAEGALIENTLYLKKHSHASQSLIDLGIGFRWETCLCKCYDFSLEALWEQHQLINGSKLWTISQTSITNPGAGGQRNTDLTVRGITLTAGLLF